MKKISLALSLIVFTLLSTSVSAQTDQGDWMVGGQLSFNTTSGNSSFTLAPNAGYFFGKNFAAGSEVTLAFSKFGDAKSSAIGVGPFARYYFELKEPNFKPLVHASFGVASVTNKFLGEKTTNTARNFFIGAGGAYFINSNVALEGVMGYNNSKVESSPSEGGFLFRIGFQIHLLGHEVKKK
ncbi:MAG: porin family protein [Sphingobacteriales bacterium]|nr:porin family protein [Sphingobacteriales bacterium]